MAAKYRKCCINIIVNNHRVDEQDAESTNTGCPLFAQVLAKYIVYLQQNEWQRIKTIVNTHKKIGKKDGETKQNAAAYV